VTTAAHFRSNLRDIFFNLFEVLDVQTTSLGKGPFQSMDLETAREALAGVEEFARQHFAPSFVEGDRVPLGFDGKGNVTLPPGFKKALDAYYDGGWNKLELPEHLGGFRRRAWRGRASSCWRPRTPRSCSTCSATSSRR
jgi:hypothetical protein